MKIEENVCQDTLGAITNVLLIDTKDFIYDKNGKIIRKKRIYGKYKREVINYDMTK